MIEIKAAGLQAGDEYTEDNGETWRRVRRVSVLKRQNRVIVISEYDGKTSEKIFKDIDTPVIVKP